MTRGGGVRVVGLRGIAYARQLLLSEWRRLA